MAENKLLRQTIFTLKQQPTVLEQNLEISRFRLASIASDDQKVTFYTGFPSYKALMACFKFLVPGVHSLVYWGNSRTELHGKKMGRSQQKWPKMAILLTSKLPQMATTCFMTEVAKNGNKWLHVIAKIGNKRNDLQLYGELKSLFGHFWQYFASQSSSVIILSKNGNFY